MLKRIVLMPVYIALTLLRIGIDLLLSLSAWIFYLLAIFLLIITACCYYMQIESAEGIKHMIIGSGVFLIIPQAASILAGILEVATEIIGDRMRSV